jgi:hypothetical protein
MLLLLYAVIIKAYNAVVAGVVVGSGLLLAFTLEEDKFDAKLPLRNGHLLLQKSDYHTQLELNYN